MSSDGREIRCIRGGLASVGDNDGDSVVAFVEVGCELGTLRVIFEPLYIDGSAS